MPDFAGMTNYYRDGAHPDCDANKDLRGTERPRPLRIVGSHTAPGFSGDILMPMPLRLTSVPAPASLRLTAG